MRAHDWAATPFGIPDTWPQSLRSLVGACLNSPNLSAVLWGPDLRMLYNDAYSPSLAERHPDALGRPVSQVWGSAWDAVAPKFMSVLETGLGTFDEEVPLDIVRHGRLVTTYWNFTAAPIRGEDGSIVGLLNQGTEVTREVLARADLQRALQERTRERDRLWELSDDIMVIADYEGRFIHANPRWTRLLGLSEAELHDSPYTGVVHPDDVPDSLQKLQAMRVSGESVRFDNRIRSADGLYRWISWTLSPEPGGQRFIGVGRDVTESRARAAELANIEEALRQSQKMEAVGQLTGGLAHDFNNLLTGITGSLEMLQTRAAQGRFADVDRYVNAAQGAAKRAAALTQRLLAFSRRQTLDPKPTDVNRLVTDMEELIRRTVGPSVKLEVVGSASLWSTRIDPNQLENALLNLCINARDAMPAGGNLTIETGNRTFDGLTTLTHDLPPGDYVTLSVSDTGTGMTPEVSARAFDPFFTTKPIGLGTGLGLSMIYGFMRQSGGQARIYSEPGAGTTVYLYLPRHRGVTEQRGESAPTHDATPAGVGETVLVVDDEPTVRMLVTEVLQDLGYVPLEAADGVAGLRILQSGVRVDLLVTDVGLPGGLNGRQLADAARNTRRDLKILFITGYAENAVLNHGHLEPGMHVLTKPFTIDALATRISKLLSEPPGQGQS